LYYRINVFPVAIPALRERKEDIPALAQVIVERLGKDMGRRRISISPEAINMLSTFNYGGNVRELHNLLERAIILTDGNILGTELLNVEAPLFASSTVVNIDLTTFEGLTLADIERQVILSTLERLNGNRTHTSDALGISLRTLRNRLREYRGSGFDIFERTLGCVA
jgi:DNA-binding NtrC family response regulator